MSLGEYHKKRDFERTVEPRGARKVRGKGGRYVIQKHAASRLHYDFRLEMGGTLKSWAVPKGIPFEKGEKHLAVQVEDHPVEYRDFEGIIPEGQYGGGTVMVWDAGTYESLGSEAAKDLAAGKLHFALKGKKLKGEWTLVRIKRGDEKQWLLIKSGADLKSVSKKKDDESALTGRTMAKIARARAAEWDAVAVPASARKQPTAKRLPAAAKPAEAPKSLRRLREPAAKQAFVAPMMATLVSAAPTHGKWRYEVKFDGFRALAFHNGQEAQLFSRNAKDFNLRFPEIAAAVAALPLHDAILDGEIVALEADGRSSFQLLQGLETESERPPLVFYVFDLLRAAGRDLRDQPLEARRERLRKIVAGASELIKFSADIAGHSNALLTEVRRLGLEGLIGKKEESVYESGRRSRNWIKLKCVHEQEFVIGGYTPPEGSRKHFGALLVGVHEGKRLLFAGKVGTGFNAAVLQLVHEEMKRFAQPNCPFSDLPEKKQGRWAQNITPREMRLCRWVAPRLVCQVKFTEWTNDRKLRHPVFLGLRDDRPAGKVMRERAVKLG